MIVDIICDTIWDMCIYIYTASMTIYRINTIYIQHKHVLDNI